MENRKIAYKRLAGRILPVFTLTAIITAYVAPGVHTSPQTDPVHRPASPDMQHIAASSKKLVDTTKAEATPNFEPTVLNTKNTQDVQNVILINGDKNNFAASPSAATPTTEPSSKPVVSALAHQPSPAAARVADQWAAQISRNQDHVSAISAQQGWAMRGESENSAWEVQAIEPNRIFIYAANNLAASISTGAHAARQTYGLSGSGHHIGVWDAGAVLPNHVEYAGRISSRDSASYVSSHATKIVGTIAASGVNASAIGGSPAATVDLHDWSGDIVEMLAIAMATPGQVGKIQLSNHSYDYSSGWSYETYPPRWIGDIQHPESEMFGSYDANAAKWDDVCRQRPYYLPIKSAGNDRADNGPIAGIPFEYWANNAWISKPYDPATDPKNDNWDNGGFDTLPVVACSKNPLVVGAVKDAVSGSERVPVNGKITSFSSWGPTDDGRVKPDIVANGWKLYTTSKSGTSSYGNVSGTSIASANAAGSALLVLEHHQQLFPDAYLLGSSIKGLLLHTADDLMATGPDYKTGWGLLNVKAACDLLSDAHDAPSTPRFVVDTIAEGTTNTHYLNWNGTDPIKVSVSWTDPAAPSSQFALDDRTSKLVHDLDVTLIAPSGAVYQPYKLDPAQPNAPATQGDNDVDNIEQIFLANPSEPGLYSVVIKVDGSLAQGAQTYSLFIDGANDTAKNRPAQTYTLSTDEFSASTGQVTLSAPGPDYDEGTKITVSATTHTDTANGIRYIPTGYTGTGNVPTSGSGTTASFFITEDSSITWQWRRQFLFRQNSVPAGLVDSANYVNEGQAVNTESLPEEILLEGTLYYLSHWTIGEIIQSDPTGTLLTSLTGLIMDESKTATAVYLEAAYDGDGDDLEDRWEIEHFNTVHHDMQVDSDGDGFSDGQEYITRTDPLDGSDFFHFDHKSQLITEPPVLTWQCKEGCEYTIYYKSSITDANWSMVNRQEIQTFGSTAEWTDAGTSSAEQHHTGFYKVDVRRITGSAH